MKPSAPRIAIIGGGWAGLSAALTLSRAGCALDIFEASKHWGGRARSWSPSPEHNQGQDVSSSGTSPTVASQDNGQHIFIGAYQHSLQLMQSLGLDIESLFLRQPLRLPWASGGGFALNGKGSQSLDMLRSVLGHPDWTWRDKWAMLRWSAPLLRPNARMPTGTVAQWCAALTPAVVRDLIEPLCVSALNTKMEDASAACMARVLQDTLQGSAPAPWRSSDLLLPRVPLAELLPIPAVRSLEQAGHRLLQGCRVQALHARQGHHPGWQLQLSRPHPSLNTEAPVYDHVIVATTATESARLLHPWQPSWSATSCQLPHESIITVYFEVDPANNPQLPEPMLALRDSANTAHGLPAQFVFDVYALQHQQHKRQQPESIHAANTHPASATQWAAVVSAATCWLDWIEQHGRTAFTRLVQQQIQNQLSAFAPAQGWPQWPVQAMICEKRATLACQPHQQRPDSWVSTPNGPIAIAGDYTHPHYPSTLEGAVISGQYAAQQTLQNLILKY